MKQFEYLSIKVNDGEVLLNELGLKGWELTTIYEGVLYFKRQIQ